MSNPRFIPRDFGEHPAAFGRFDPTWRDQDNERDWRLLRAAQFQHRVALVARQHMLVMRWKQPYVARQVGISADRLGRILRGEQPMALEEITELLSIAGHQAMLEPRNDR